jgi:hypothetical protein
MPKRPKLTTEELQARIVTNLAAMDGEGFSWLAITIAGMGRPPIWPDGLGGFRDRERIAAVVTDAKAYVEAGS